MEPLKTCCVTGHRDIPKQQKETITRLLRQEILEAIADGYTHFISGFAVCRYCDSVKSGLPHHTGNPHKT